ncbi:MAG: bifunctional diaminohydroxyphosphoribosylaminopyrimidine deaminase/5-amino-6-(5-phosphoribosylamino)uracil reductase RibD [Rhizobiales bacterium]|nr:bifunctional diaminohydroxyphosphoribosylaminopyrimidine deaminase/5-amino-6-(5-phosphoribosylamino)uracil reductase RibD [Hyphomicrobiales bacterium]
MTPTTDERDASMMASALALARRGLGRVWPNPAVGCIIADESEADAPRVIARGWTGEGGRPHAEAMALEQAGDKARGATAYVTFEPCSHHGQTPPCAAALIDAGVARVVSALEDPDPRVSGKGHAALKAAGIDLVVGCMAREAARLNAGFITRVRLGRPHVTLKLATSNDGMIAAAPGKPVRLTGEAADARVHMMRAQADAILVGSGTWRADDPQLTCRLAGMGGSSPVRVVIDARAELPLISQLVTTIGTAPVWAMVGEGADSARRDALARAGVKLIDVTGAPSGRLDIAAVLSTLARQGITRLLVEGGAQMAQSLIGADLADQIVIFEAPVTLGPRAVPALGHAARDMLADETRFVLVSSDRLGPDTMRAYEKKR